MTDSDHWSINVPEQKLRPKGVQEHLDYAKEILGPFADEHRSKGGCRCEACAEERIRKLVRNYNAVRHMARNAPRVAHIAKAIQKIATQSQQLAETLAGLDDYSRDCLFKARQLSPEEAKQLFKEARVRDMPPPSTVATGDGVLVAQLTALSQFANLSASRFSEGLYETPFPISDVGGNTNIVTQWYGTPTELIVIGAYHIFDFFKAEGARKTEGGPFHCFVNEVHSFATGSVRGQSHLFEIIKKKLGPKGALKVAKLKPLRKKLKRESTSD